MSHEAQQFQPSKYQQAIFTFVREGKGSGVIEAVAGSGKTTTIVQALNLIPSSHAVCFLAFNKSIAMELKKRVPAHVQASTLNSLGHRALTKFLGRFVQLDAKKSQGILDRIIDASNFGDEDWEKLHANRSEILKLVALAKAHGLAPMAVAGVSGLMQDAADSWQHLIDWFGVDVDDRDFGFVVDLARRVLQLGLRERQVIDFDDQLYMTVLLNVPMFRFDWLFVDESQDISPIQRALLRKALKPGGRLVAVGDSHQAIYGFRGAASDSMTKIAEEFGAVTLPLSISYRCPQQVVAYAQKVVPTIEAAATAPEGEVYCLAKYGPADFGIDDLVICRNTKPLVSFAYQLIAARVPLKVLGRDIGSGLIALINRLDKRKKGRYVHGEKGLVERIMAWRVREREKYIARGEEEKADSIEDKAETLMVFIEHSEVERTDDLIREIDSMFTDRGDRCLTLATIHKAKGLEAGKVFVLNPDLMPSPYARKDWQRKQEENLIYVAVTRAKQSLVFIDDKRFENNAAVRTQAQVARAG